MECSGNSLLNDKKEVIQKFRNNLADVLTPEHTDYILLKWLRARNFDVQKAEQLFRMVHQNRITYEVNTITETYSRAKILVKHERTAFLGFAKDGSSIRYVDFHMDYNGFAHTLSTYDLVLYFSYLIEGDLKKMKEREEPGETKTEITYILDFEHFTLQDLYYKCVIESGFDLFALYQDHYPEGWRYILVVNAPYVFDKFLTLFKPVLNAPFLDKMKIAPKSSSPQLLRQYIDDDVLPAFLGGSRVDSKGDPYCREFIIDYHKIPEENYLRNIMPLISESDPGVKVATIRARRVYNACLTVKNTKDKMRLEMRTEKGSIHFCILFRNTESNDENLDVPDSEDYLDPNDKNSNVCIVGSRIRMQSHLSPYDGKFTPNLPGLYIFQFDNTASWISSRKLFYRITLISADE